MNKYNIKLDIVSSRNKNKKFDAIYTDLNGKFLIVPFGQKGASDYTTNFSDEKRINYLKRHHKNENWDNPFTSGSLSRYILWGNSTNINKNISDFKKLFNFI